MTDEEFIHNVLNTMDTYEQEQLEEQAAFRFAQVVCIVICTLVLLLAFLF